MVLVRNILPFESQSNELLGTEGLCLVLHHIAFKRVSSSIFPHSVGVEALGVGILVERWYFEVLPECMGGGVDAESISRSSNLAPDFVLVASESSAVLHGLCLHFMQRVNFFFHVFVRILGAGDSHGHVASLTLRHGILVILDGVVFELAYGCGFRQLVLHTW